MSDGLAAWLPVTTAVLWRATALLAEEVPPVAFDAVALLLDVLLPIVPRLVLLLVLTPLRRVVLPVPVNTRSSFCVSNRGTYDVFVEKCPPCPSPGPWPCPQ